MADCVSRDDVRRFIADAFSENRFATNYDYAILTDKIDEIPAVDVQPVRRGEWIVDNDFYTCSRCNHQYLIDKILSMTIYPSGGMPYYCPCCGADMREPLKGNLKEK